MRIAVGDGMRFFLLLAVLAAACGGAVPEPVRLREVVLYQNGVGYFERRGHPGTAVALPVREHEIDDVLTTLTVVGEGGEVVAPAVVLPDDAIDGAGRLTIDAGMSGPVRVSYATQTSAWRASYRLVLPDERGAGDAMLQGWAVVDNTTAEDWRDVNVTLATAAPLSFAVDLRTPRIVERPDVTGHRASPIALGPVVAERARETADTDHDGILDATDVCPDDPEGHNGAADGDGCPDRGRVVVDSHEVRILEHVFFRPGSAAIEPSSIAAIDAVAATYLEHLSIDRLTIHGHADDVEDDPWRLSGMRAEAVKAALVERGVPAARLEVVPHGATQPIDGGGTDAARARNRRVEYEVVRTTPRATGAEAGVTAEGLRRTAPTRTVPSSTSGTRFVLRRRVSVPAGRSAMVAMLGETVPGEDVLLFRPDPNAPASDVHPFRAARLRNGDLELVPGPITLFARGELVGQGLLGGLRPGETAFVPYALDTGSRVEAEVSEREVPSRLLSIHEGELRIERIRIRTTRYAAEPSPRAPARLFIRHPRAPGYEPHELPPSTETSPDALLVPVPIVPLRASTLAIEERRAVVATVALDGDLDVDLGRYAVDDDLDPRVRARLDALLEDRRALADLHGQVALLHQRLGENGHRTSELRQSVAALAEAAGTGAVRRRIAQTLAQAVADGEALARDLAELRAREVEARARLRDAVRGFDAVLSGG